MKQTILLIFIIFSSILRAQNLIPNGDFELGPERSSFGWCCGVDSNCSLIDTILGPDFWNVVSGSPDRLIEGDIPDIFPCYYDNDTAQSGIAYTVFIYDEAGKTILLASLQKDSIYHLQYFASLETFQGSAQSSKIEFNFNNGGNSIATPYIAFPKWQYFDTVFVASGNSTEIEIRGIEIVTCGVKIDNISLKKNFGASINDIQNNKDNITLFPNPADDFIYVALKNKIFSNLTLVNGVGEVLKTETVKMSNCIRVDVSDFPKGFYIVSVQLENGKFITTKFLKFK